MLFIFAKSREDILQKVDLCPDGIDMDGKVFAQVQTEYLTRDGDTVELSPEENYIYNERYPEEGPLIAKNSELGVMIEIKEMLRKILEGMK